MVDRGGLENRFRRMANGGSNPPLSAGSDKEKMERCPSWPKGHDWKSCEGPQASPRVRIPLSPLYFIDLSCEFTKNN